MTDEERKRIEVMNEIHGLLAEFYSEAETELWWLSPHPLHDGKTPRQVVDEGNAAALLTGLRKLDDAVYL